MTSREKHISSNANGDFTRKTAGEGPRMGAYNPEVSPSYDPELLYVECQACGKPVLW